MKTRRAFTLVELLVSMALVVFIMVIISETFVTALNSVRLLKAQGEMQANLRVASTRLRGDLTAAHFGTTTTPSQEISQQYNLAVNPLASPSWGYFRVMHGSRPGALVGTPATPSNPLYYEESAQTATETHPSYAAVDHVLAMTKQDPITKQWSEVAYFLQPNGAAAGGSALYALYRRENYLPGNPAQDGSANDWSVPYNRYGMQNANWQASNGPQNSFGTGPNPIVGAPVAAVTYVSGTSNWGMPNWSQAWLGAGNQYVTLDANWENQTAAGYDTAYKNATGSQTPISPAGDDLLLTNVISFEVRVSIRTLPPAQQPTPYGFLDLYTATDQLLADRKSSSSSSNFASKDLNSQFYNGSNNTAPAVFDTWCQWLTKTWPDAKTWQGELQAALQKDPAILNVPMPVQIVAVQVTLRVWDERTQQARQITIVQNV